MPQSCASPPLRHDVAYDNFFCRTRGQTLAHSGHQKIGDERGVQISRPDDDDVRRMDCRRSLRIELRCRFQKEFLYPETAVVLRDVNVRLSGYLFPVLQDRMQIGVVERNGENRSFQMQKFGGLMDSLRSGAVDRIERQKEEIAKAVTVKRAFFLSKRKLKSCRNISARFPSDRATRQRRTSPGGSIPNSSRRTPVEPPLSNVEYTAVIWRGKCLSPRASCSSPSRRQWSRPFSPR